MRLAQKLIWALQTRTAEGVCYEIDARLRPSGQSGHAGHLARQLRRAITPAARRCGNARRCCARARSPAARASRDAFRALRREILLRPLPAGAAAEIRRIRQRMENELAHETDRRHDFKTGRGGLLDVESVVQFLQLRHGAAHPELLEVDRIGAQIDAARAPRVC